MFVVHKLRNSSTNITKKVEYLFTILVWSLTWVEDIIRRNKYFNIY